MNANKHNKVLQYVARTFLLLVFVLSADSFCFASRDCSDERTFGNVYIDITSSFRYEENNQAFMLGSYAQLLSEELNYHEPISIIYRHIYDTSIQPEYYISMGNSQRVVDDSTKTTKEVTNKETLFIRIFAYNLNFTETIKMIEFAILNKTKIEAKQVQYHVDKAAIYRKYNLNAYPLDALAKVSEKKLSKVASHVLSQVMVRPKMDFEITKRDISAINYFCRNDSMLIDAKRINKADTVLLSLPDIHWFEKLNDNASALIFDTDTTFYYAEVDQYQKATISKQQVIKNRQYNYYPFECKKVGTNKIFITFSVPDNRILDARDVKAIQERVFDRTVFYDTKYDRLIQDFDRFMKGTQ